MNYRSPIGRKRTETALGDRLTPTPEQRAAIERIVSEPTRAALIASDTGSGKTLMAVEIARDLGARTVLVIGPKKTAVQWQTRVVGQDIELPFYHINAESDDADQLHVNFVAGVPGVYFVGREFFYLSATELKPKTKKIVAEDGTATTVTTPGREKRWSWNRGRPDLVIVDESHAAQNRWGHLATTLKTLKPNFKLMMSATPGRNYFKGLWAPCRWLWPDARNADGSLIVDNSQWRWAAQYATIIKDPYAGKKITDERVPGAFVACLPCYIRFEVPKVPVETRKVRIELSPRQREIYDTLVRDALVWLGEHPLVTDLPIVQKTRLRQIALGEPTIIDGEVTFAPDCASAKADACQKIIDKYHPADHIVFYTDSQRFAHVLAQRLPGAVEYSGAVSHKDRAQAVEDFIAGRVKRLVAVIPAVAEGLDGLQEVCHVEVWLNRSFDGTLNTQAEGRTNRMGQRAPKIVRYELSAAGTDDDKDIERLVHQARTMQGSLRL